jgi:DNA-binding NarL/FixJ family response regulator
LGEVAYHAAFGRGQQMSSDEVFAYALQEKPATRASSSWTSLTRRQRQVAELVARGLSNQEIADALVISRRTAEGHVDKLFKALGLTSRAQMAAWFSGHHQV